LTLVELKIKKKYLIKINLNPRLIITIDCVIFRFYIHVFDFNVELSLNQHLFDKNLTDNPLYTCGELESPDHSLLKVSAVPPTTNNTSDTLHS